MKRIFAVSVACMLIGAQLPSVHAQLEASGAIAGTVRCPKGALGAVTVQAIDAAGAVAGAGLTNTGGAFRINRLRPGVYTMQVLGTNRRVIGVASARLTAETMLVTVNIDGCSGTLAAPAVEAAAGAGRGGSNARLILAGVGAAAAALGTLAVISTQDDVSGSR